MQKLIKHNKTSYLIMENTLNLMNNKILCPRNYSKQVQMLSKVFIKQIRHKSQHK